MKNFYMDTPKEIHKFVDRKEIRDIIMQEVEHRIMNKNYFKVVSIYGFGGMGKTCLINELKEQIYGLRKKYRICSVSFEIQNNNQYLENLIKICKEYNRPCILFYYGLMRYWDKTAITQLNTAFMDKVGSSFLTNFMDAIHETGSSFVSPIAEELPSIPSISNTLDCVGKILNAVREIPYYHDLKKIQTFDTETLLKNLPILLAMDICHNEYEKKNTKLIIFVFDSYQQSMPYSESVEWLLKLIGTIHRGLFIVTSREKLLWDDPEKDIIPYHLQGYPEDEARAYLESLIPTAGIDILNAILINTQCVPIYIDLAIDVYQKEHTIHPNNIVNKSLFDDRESLVFHFINHLKPEWQQTIMDLAVIRVFNFDIFCYLVKEQNLSCPIDDYSEIINVSLMHYVENTHNLVKIHDVFCNNILKVLSCDVKYDVLYKYLNYIITREAYKQYDNQIGAIITLFINIINVEIDIAIQDSLPQKIVEKTLDLFFMLWNIQATFSMIIPNINYSDPINDLLNFINAIWIKSKSTQSAIEYLNEIKEPNNFGYHQISYDVFKKYTLSLTGDYGSLKRTLKIYQENLGEELSSHWYYTQIKLYIADYLTMEGKFLTAYDVLDQLEKLLDNSIFTVNNYFYIKRYKGHIFRFNFCMEEASYEYTQVLSHPMCSSSMKAYIYTNYIESNCYLKPEYVFENFDMAITAVREEKQIKNEGKLYYSRAISNIVYHQYEQAKNDIEQSLFLNHKDGYQSGELFAYMAKSYLEFAQNGHISENTFEIIDNLLINNAVYEYFRLPLALMLQDMQMLNICKEKYEWIDFAYTVQCYNTFFNSIKE